MQCGSKTLKAMGMEDITWLWAEEVIDLWLNEGLPFWKEDETLMIVEI